MSDIQNSKASVFVFFDINCPVCQSFTSEIVGLQEKTKSNNIQWYCIIPSTTCDLDSIRKFTESFRFPIRMIRDEKGILSHNLKAEITPEAFLINSSGRIMYRGAINNLFEDLGTRRQVVTKNYLSDAIQQYLNGMDILVKETKAVGCFIE